MTEPRRAFRGIDDFEDMSDYLVHLTRETTPRSAYDNALELGTPEP